MKCQSCDIHEGTQSVCIPEILTNDVAGGKKYVSIKINKKIVCSECVYELAEKIRDMF